jgi:polysaccharide biosynthesis/export protein
MFKALLFNLLRILVLQSVVAATAFVLTPGIAGAEYLLGVGDVIEITVARVPDLQRRVPVQMDGTISFPMLGSINALGITQLELQTRIQATLASKVIRVRLPDGREDSIAIDPSDVTAIVVEYRPIYVNGDVAKPGEYLYRPLMTVHQAIALAGGYDGLHATVGNPILESADIRSAYDSLWNECAKDEIHGLRLKAELNDKGDVDQKSLQHIPLAPSVIANLVKLETEQLKLRLLDNQREKAFLQHSIAQTEQQIGVLSEQESQEDQGTRADADELKRALDLFSKGTLTSSRVTDARRAVLLSSTRKLQITAQLMQVKKQQEEYARQLERLGDRRGADLLQELRDSDVALADCRSRLQGAREKVEYMAMARSRLGSDKTETEPSITIMRKGPKEWESISGNNEFELQPGDVVEVSLRSQKATSVGER